MVRHMNRGRTVSNPYQQPNPYGGQQYPPPAHGPAYGYPQAPQPPHGGLPHGPQPPAGEPNQLATASVYCGFGSIVGILFCYGGLLGFVGIGLGIAALNRAKRTGTGRGQALGGIALSVIGVMILVAFVVFYKIILDKTDPYG